MTKSRLLWSVVIFQFAAILIFMFLMVPKFSAGLVSCDGCDQNSSAYEIAAQIGRLDAVSLTLSFLGIGVGFFAIFGFFAIKDEAVRVAESTAERIVKEEVKVQVELAMKQYEKESSTPQIRIVTPNLESTEEME